MVTLNRKNIQRIVSVTAVALVLVLGVIFLPQWGTDDTTVANATAPTTPTTPTAPTTLKTADDLLLFLQSYGVEADLATATVTTVTVPRKWDDNFKAFNEVVKQSGYDLKEVKNKNVDKWFLLCPALTNETTQMYAVVLVREEKPVGVYYLEKPSGNVVPLLKPQATETASALTEEELAANANFAQGLEQASQEGETSPENTLGTSGEEQETLAPVLNEADMPTE